MNDILLNLHHPDRPIKQQRSDLHDRRTLRKRAPQVEDLDAELIAYLERAGDVVPPCLGQVVNTECLRSVLEAQWQRTEINPVLVSPRTVIFRLPIEFEPCLVSFVEQRPQVFNHPNTALRNNTTYQGWTVCLPGHSAPIEVWVLDFALHEATSEAWCYQEREWGWVPVVAMAGDSVAICGFEVDEAFICSGQAARMSASGSNPEDVYSQERLDAAASLGAAVGLMPWFQSDWKTADWARTGTSLVLGATFYSRDDADLCAEHSPAG